MKRLLFLFVTAAVMTITVSGQQVPDTTYNPVITNPAYKTGSGPLIFIDEGHFNFHTRGDRYLPFAMLLENDGYRTEAYSGRFVTERLGRASILVISNALNEINTERWYKPVLPAFSPEEVETVREWVEKGGSLFLIADHMPMGGAAAGMAEAFGFGFTDGFAADTVNPGPSLFCRAENTLTDNVITNGNRAGERVDSIYSFTGQAFTIPDDASSILKFSDGYTLLLSDTAWVFNRSTRYQKIAGWSQLAYKQYGKGRVIAAGEAAMFTAQLAGQQQARVGMNAPYAGYNHRLLLNIIHWLDFQPVRQGY